MPRGERPLDAGDGVLLRFAGDLRRLRRKAGNPTYRTLAGRVHYSVATLSEAAAGRKLPSLAVTLAYVRACGGDAEEWERRWHAVAADLAAGRDADAAGGAAPGADDTAPYVGLPAFQVADAHRFFGRERLLDELDARLARQRFVPVIGASGAGKSSLLRAGLLARGQVAGGGRRMVLFTPGEHPVQRCAVALADLTDTTPETIQAELDGDRRGLHRLAGRAMTGRPADAELVLLVDQFEEIFTLCHDAGERARFIGALTHAVRAGDSRCRVVLGLRADFFPHCTNHPELVAAFDEAPLVVGPMTAEELRRAVTEPAVRAGYTVENALLAMLVAQAHGQVGVLPLLSHALLQTWRRRRGNTLTLAGFQAAGGIDGALAHTAESLYRALPAGQQRLARDLLLRLTALGDGTADTKRRLARDDVATGPDTAVVMSRLAEARLITLDRDSVEITHEALIQCWPRLRDWLTEDRDGLRVHHQLGAAAKEWDDLGRDPGALYRGARLAAVQSWAGAGDHHLTAREAGFLAASLAAQDTERIAANRRTRRLRALAAALGVLAVLATTSTGVAIRAQQTAARQRDDATSQRVAGAATALRATRPALAVQLALAAYRLSPTPEARGALLSMFATPYATELAGTEPVESVGFSPDGRTLATGEDREVRLWDTTDPHHPRMSTTLTGLAGTADTLAFTPDGQTLAATGADGAVVRWDVSDQSERTAPPRRRGAAGGRSAALSPDGRTVATAAHPVAFGPRGDLLAITGGRDTVRVRSATGAAAVPRAVTLVPVSGRGQRVNAAAFAPDRRTVATAGEDGVIRLWDVADPRHPRQTVALTGHTDAVRSVAFSPDGRTLVSGGADAAVRLWDTADARRPRQLASLPGHVAAVNSVAFSPDGRTVASGGADHVTRLWRLPGPWLVGHDSSVYSVAFSPDGRRVASGSYDRTVKLWEIDGSGQPHPTATLRGHTAAVNSVAFRADGGAVASASLDRTVRLWRLAGPSRSARAAASLAHPDSVEDLAFGPRGAVLATAGHDGTLRLWDATAPDRPVSLAALAGHAGSVESVAFSPDGRVLATGGADRTVRLWNVADPHRPVQTAVLNGHTDAVKAIAFSPHGRTLASGGEDRSIRLWDVGDPLTPAQRDTLTGHTDGVNSLVFASGGRVLVSASSDRTVRLWAAADPRRAAELATLTGHAKPVDALAVGPDGGTIATGSEDWTALLWKIVPDDVAREVCAIVSSPVTRPEWERYFPGHPYQPPCP